MLDIPRTPWYNIIKINVDGEKENEKNSKRNH